MRVSTLLERNDHVGLRLPPLAGRQPRYPAQRYGQRLPAGKGASARPRLRIVGYSREQPAQLGGGGELAALVEGGADGGGLCLRDDEHLRSMGTRARANK